MTSPITFSDVTFAWPGAAEAVVEHVDLTIGNGEFVLLTGPSGSGKSTMLRMLNGLVPHSSGGRFGGTVHLHGVDIRSTSTRNLASTVGMVFQDPEAQMITSRVDDEIAFALEQRSIEPRIIRQRIEDVLDLLGIDHLRHRIPNTLSGGEQQRVAIAAAMALRPHVLALDEPTSQLDPAAADGVLDVLSRMHDDLGMTIVAAEHRLERLLHRADRVIDAHDSPHIADLGAPNMAAATLPVDVLPPVTRLGRLLQMSPLPLTVSEARRAGLQERFQSRHPTAIPAVDSPGGGEVVTALSDATVRFYPATVLDAIDFSVHSSEVVALMGRNGSGKTTLLRTIAGFQDLTSGTFPVPRPTSFAWLPQQASTVFFQETVRSEIAWTLRQRGSADTVDSVLAEFDLTHLAGRNPRDLSGGERERAAMAAMLAGDPSLILLDEPTRGMDGHQKSRLVTLLRRRRDNGAAIVLATHDVELVGRIASRVVILGHGSVVATGTPGEILPGSLSIAPQVTRLLGTPWMSVDDLPVTWPGVSPTAS